MTKEYRIFADILHKYYIDITAESPELAYDEARSRPTNEWFEIKTDAIPDPFHVQEKDTTNLE